MKSDAPSSTAFELALRGWRVVPVSPLDNRPLIPIGCAAASGNAEDVLAWSKAWPKANYALPCGPESGVLALTIQARKRADGFAHLRYLEEQFEPLPLTAAVVAPSGDCHFLFAHPENSLPLKLGALMLPEPDGQLSEYFGMSVRGAGSGVFLPPSSGPEGSYAWANSIFKTAPALIPAWFLGIILAPQRDRAANLPELRFGLMTPPETAAILERECRALASMDDRYSQEAALFKLATSFGQAMANGAMDQDTAERALILTAFYGGLINSAGLREVVQEIYSGLRAGLRNPGVIR